MVRAFTLIEILLVLVLLGLVGGLGVTATGSLFGGHEQRGVDIFWTAVQQARSHALVTEQPVELNVSDDGQGLVLKTKTGQRTFNLPGDITVEITYVGLSWGETARAARTGAVRFYRDGTCDGFKARLGLPAGRGLELMADAWTCAPLVTSSDGSRP